MTKLYNFDVLIVYTESLAASASDTAYNNTSPFHRKSSNKSYNNVYAYFLETCHQQNLSAAFTTSADIVGPGFCRSFWMFKDQKWIRVNSPCYSALIFDKFSPTKNRIKISRQLLFSSPKIKSFTDPNLFNLFFDKQKTYDILTDYSIPTITVRSDSLQNLNQSCQTLKKLISLHPKSKDFSSDIIMKDRFGAGGKHVYKFNSGQTDKMLAVIRKNTHTSFVIQPFTKFDRGFSHRNRLVSTDIRLVYLQGKIVQSYIRTAKFGEFLCNEHQGGSLTYIPIKDIPASLIAKSNSIATLLNKTHSLYALDFIISNFGNTYLLEGNTGPGLDWNPALIKNETEAKKLISLVVTELASRAATANLN